MQKNLRPLAIGLLFTMLLTILCISLWPWTAKSLEKEAVFSEGLTESSFPNDLAVMDILRVDLNQNTDCTDGHWRAEIALPCVPDGLYAVIMTDGWHILQAQWQTEENILRLAFPVQEIQRLDSTIGLWLITIQKQ